jgi:DNA repair protein RadC
MKSRTKRRNLPTGLSASTSLLTRRVVDHRVGGKVKEEIQPLRKWKHPGGKLRELGPKALSTKELLAILISTGYKGKSAEDVADELLKRFGSLENLSNVPLAKLLEIKGLGDVKIIRIAAALELARRTSEEILSKHAKKV